MNRAVEALIYGIREMRPRLNARAREIDSARRIPADIVQELLRMGVFRMNTPKSHGGLELAFPDSCEVVAEMAKVCGSAGWVVMIGGFSSLLLGRLPRQIYEVIYRDGPDICVGGSAVPAGTAEVYDGGYRVTGRWPFATGCTHADWLFGFCIATQNGVPAPEPMKGIPPLRIVMLPAKDWQIEDTWFAEGLKGTGSHHIALNDAWVPESNVVDLVTGHPTVGGPLFQAVPGLFATTHTAFALGLAEGAVEDLIDDLTGTGRRPVYGHIALKDAPTVQYELGRAEVQLRAVRALMQEQCDIDWQDALAGRVHDLDRTTRRYQTATWTTETCARVVETCYRLGGSRSVYETSPLQRRFRDINAAAQHVSVNLRHYLVSGAQRLGHDPVHPLFAA